MKNVECGSGFRLKIGAFMELQDRAQLVMSVACLYGPLNKAQTSDLVT